MEYYLFRCKDINVAISPMELDAMCNSGNVLRGLVFGNQGGLGEHHEANLSLFSGFDHKWLNMLRACVKGVEVDVSNPFVYQEFLDFAHTFGGFSCVDKYLTQYMEAKDRAAYNPSQDVKNIYEWKSIPWGGDGGGSVASQCLMKGYFEEIESQGFKYSGQTGDIHFFRRELDNDDELVTKRAKRDNIDGESVAKRVKRAAAIRQFEMA